MTSDAWIAVANAYVLQAGGSPAFVAQSFGEELEKIGGLLSILGAGAGDIARVATRAGRGLVRAPVAAAEGVMGGLRTAGNEMRMGYQAASRGVDLGRGSRIAEGMRTTARQSAERAPVYKKMVADAASNSRPSVQMPAPPAPGPQLRLSQTPSPALKAGRFAQTAGAPAPTATPMRTAQQVQGVNQGAVNTATKAQQNLALEGQKAMTTAAGPAAPTAGAPFGQGLKRWWQGAPAWQQHGLVAGGAMGAGVMGMGMMGGGGQGQTTIIQR